MALLAIRRLAIEAEGDDDGMYAVAVQQLAVSTFKGVDACFTLLGRTPATGWFAGEFYDQEGHPISFTKDGADDPSRDGSEPSEGANG
jgi:hypothetical protein